MFKKAVRSQTKLKLAIVGPSGSGKTFSALRLAKGLGAKVMLIDAENGSASLYADQFDFEVNDLAPPFSVERYQAAIEEAERLGCDVLIIDSLTHAWAGEGGLLEEKEKLDARNKNSFANWAHITKKHEAFKSAILHSPLHIIATMRSKQEYAQVEENGRRVVKKLGMAPIQRDGIEYEFTVMFDVAMNHEAEASKDRTGLFTGKIFKITEQTGETLAKWLSTAAPVEKRSEAAGERRNSLKADDKQTAGGGGPENTTQPSPPKVTAKAFGQPEGTSDPADYVLPLGVNKGSALKSVPLDQLMKLADWIEGERKKGSISNTWITALERIQTFIDAASMDEREGLPDAMEFADKPLPFEERPQA